MDIWKGDAQLSTFCGVNQKCPLSPEYLSGGAPVALGYAESKNKARVSGPSCPNAFVSSQMVEGNGIFQVPFTSQLQVF